MTTPTLFPLPPADGRLTARQTQALALVRDGGATALDVGAVLHRQKACERCWPEAPCGYAEADGRDVLDALRRKGLVKRRKADGVWLARGRR